MTNKVGADPETFIQKNGKALCPSIFSPTPKEVLMVSEHGGVNRDGMAMELNPTPGDPATVWMRMQSLLHHIEKVALSVGAEVVKNLVIDISGVEIPPEASDVFEAGCLPDMNAYSGQWNKPPEHYETVHYRAAGGHITFDISPLVKEKFIGGIPDFNWIREMVRRLDATVGLASVAWQTDMNAAQLRRKTYGRAGDFRPKDGIIEYRTPDASWLWNGRFPALAQMGLDVLNEKLVPKSEGGSVVQAINTADAAACRRLFQTLNNVELFA